MTVFAIGDRTNNAQLIADCAQLGYLQSEWETLDPTYGKGRFWSNWEPANLTCSDILGKNDLIGKRYVRYGDFTELPYEDKRFDVTVFDPPYKLNGTSTGKGVASSDVSYGVDVPSTWEDRHKLISLGIAECARVTGRILLIKCQDQVVSGKKRWQTRIFADVAELQGFELIDMLHVQGYRPQPEGRRQVHSRGDYSTLLVTKRKK